MGHPPAPWQNGYVSEALGRYAFARRHVKRPDPAAEQALFRVLDAINQVLTDGYAYGALLSTSPTRRAAYLAMAEETWRWTMGPESAPGVPFSKFSYCCPQTPAKNAAIRLRFGQVYQWLRQQPDVAASRGR